MATKRSRRQSLTDALTRALAPEAKPSRVSFIKDGIKYKSGQAPVRVCPAGGVPPHFSDPIAAPVVAPSEPAAA